jgi:O-antigen biosynthesis protein
MIEDLYRAREDAYFSSLRKDLLPFFHGTDKKVLEVGCAKGTTLRELKRLKIATEIVGVEMNKKAAKIAEQILNKTFIGNIEEISLPYKKYFDYIILADILEHLVNPWVTLDKCSNYLKDDGFLIASIPNFRNLEVFIEIFLKGDLEYQKAGLLDKGHLRFFTQKSIEKTFLGSGFKIVDIIPNLDYKTKFRHFLNISTFKKLEFLFVVQYLIKAKKIKES